LVKDFPFPLKKLVAMIMREDWGGGAGKKERNRRHVCGTGFQSRKGSGLSRVRAGFVGKQKTNAVR